MDPIPRLRATERFARARELRHSPTPAERHAWTLLRNRGILSLKFRRQHVLHGFIVDFFCPSQRIVIEFDGDVHDAEEQRDYDRARAGFLEAAGYVVIRVRNKDVSREHFEAVLCAALGTNPSFPLSRRERGSGGEDQTYAARRGGWVIHLPRINRPRGSAPRRAAPRAAIRDRSRRRAASR